MFQDSHAVKISSDEPLAEGNMKNGTTSFDTRKKLKKTQSCLPI